MAIAAPLSPVLDVEPGGVDVVAGTDRDGRTEEDVRRQAMGLKARFHLAWMRAKLAQGWERGRPHHAVRVSSRLIGARVPS